MSNELKSIEDTVAIKVEGNSLVIKGFMYGLQHPSLIVRLSITIDNCQEWLTRVDQVLSDLLGEVPGDIARPHRVSGHTDELYAINFLLFWMSRLERSIRVPVFEQGKVLGFFPETRSALIAIPTIPSSHQTTGKLLSWLLHVMNKLYAERDIHALIEEFPAIVKQLKRMGPKIANMPLFVRTAFDLGIPCSEIAGQVYQFGYGSRSRLLDSSFTDQTSQIGTRLARIKTLTAAVLRRAGIPVSDHIMVTESSGAEKAAGDLGFPVVVKPADLDGGVGVAAGLTTQDEVREAFAVAQKSSRSILVEKHYDGRDYRLTVFQGELIWAIERLPGGVTGDGKSSVQTLVELLNADPRRGEGPHASLKRIVLDDEAQSLLSKAGMGFGTVPGEGEFVRLRRRANVACGGMPVAVFEHVHPDNRLLAVRATAALRLDLAGVDVLIPDISRSWRESGAVVCEVNAQPNLGEITSAHIYPQILRKLVQGSGRIPITVIVGSPQELDVAAAVALRLGSAGLVTGRGDHEGVSIGTTTITAGVVDPYNGGRILMGDKSVDAAILCINDLRVLHTGLPFERFDLLVLAGTHLLPDAKDRASRVVQLRTLFNALSPCCDGKVIVVEGSRIAVHALLSSSSAELLKEPVAQDALVETIAEAMIAADDNHRIGRPAFLSDQA